MDRILNTADLLPRQWWDGNRTPEGQHLAAVVEASDLFTAGTSGRNARAQFALREALARADFNVLLGQSFEVEMLATYEEIDPEWQKVFARTTVKDFKPKKFIELFGGRGPLDEVAEGEEYKERSKDEAEYDIKVGKFGNRFQLTWELRKNDELDGLSTFPDDLAHSARETEDATAFGILATATGPNTDFFRAPRADEKRANNAVDNKPLTRENLEAAYNAILARRGHDGRPVRLRGQRLLLVVPLALELQALAIVNTPTVEITEGSRKYTVPNPIAGKFEVVPSHWITELNTSAKAATTWYITGAPTIPRKALAVAFMRGEENPDIRVKADQGSRVGGGALGVDDGSFDDDTINYRGRHVVGASGLDPITTYASTGSS